VTIVGTSDARAPRPRVHVHRESKYPLVHWGRVVLLG
jgi:hypothetical protein